MTIVEFFFDIISPFSRIQHELLMRQLKHWKSMQLKMTPVLIRKVFEISENKPPGLNPTKAAYLFTDLLMVSEYHKIPFALPQNFMKIAFEFNTDKTQQFLLAIQDDLDQDTYNRLVGHFYQNFFHPTDSLEIYDVSVMKKLASDMEISQDLIEKAAQAVDSEEIKIRLQKNIDRVVKLGAFGLPVTMVHSDDPKWVFGSDRMHLIGYLLGEKEPPIFQ